LKQKNFQGSENKKSINGSKVHPLSVPTKEAMDDQSVDFNQDYNFEKVHINNHM
jgi:hypothetical protein